MNKSKIWVVLAPSVIQDIAERHGEIALVPYYANADWSDLGRDEIPMLKGIAPTLAEALQDAHYERATLALDGAVPPRPQEELIREAYAKKQKQPETESYAPMELKFFPLK